MTPLEALKLIYINLDDLESAEAAIVLLKSLRALNIIKEKRVDVYLLILSIEKVGDKALDYYNHYMSTIQLTQEEYDLLKEILK